ncbi:hypothetical protein HDU93_010054 [Gonapodya sp. JEL0774]|nr:hypothetical protein HDU93_010054 [Gonapodya sp. JEL0774]
MDTTDTSLAQGSDLYADLLDSRMDEGTPQPVPTHYLSHAHYHDGPEILLSSSERTVEQLQDQMEEERVFFRCVAAFMHYKLHSLGVLARRRRHHAALTDRHKSLLRMANFEQKLHAAELGVMSNSDFLKSVVAEDSPFPYDDDVKRELNEVGTGDVSESDIDKVRSTIRQVLRDWSSEGTPERDTCYNPIMEAIDRAFSEVPIEERASLRVLVPGAGLGRLCYEIAKRGYSAQGNEFSFYMLLTSNYLLNRVTRRQQHVIYPWVHSFSHAPMAADTVSAVAIPDEVPNNLPRGVEFSMVAGDFVEIYGSEKEKGSEEETSVELSLDEIRTVAEAVGFVFEEARMVDATYAHNPRSMMAFLYRCAFWVARKRD